MRRFDFEDLVRCALESLPEGLRECMSNVDVLVRRWPTPRQLKDNDVGEGETLLGLYEGVPLIERSSYNWVVPDTITIFQAPIERSCRSSQEVVEEVRRTVIHEVAHHFGISDQQLERWGVY